MVGRVLQERVDAAIRLGHRQRNALQLSLRALWTTRARCAHCVVSVAAAWRCGDVPHTRIKNHLQYAPPPPTAASAAKAHEQAIIVRVGTVWCRAALRGVWSLVCVECVVRHGPVCYQTAAQSIPRRFHSDHMAGLAGLVAVQSLTSGLSR